MNAAVLKKMRDMGLTLDQAIELAEAMEEGFAKPVPGLSPGAVRTRKWREKKEAEAHHAERHGDSHGDASPRDEPEPSRVVYTSLPSEELIITPSYPSDSPAPKSKPARSRQAPAGWEPPPAEFVKLVDAGFSPGEIERELAKFRDHEFSSPKSDWLGAFRNWLKRSREFAPRNVPRTHPQNTRAERRSAWAEILAEDGGSGAGLPARTG